MNGHTEMINLLKRAGTVEPKKEALIPSAKEQKTSRPILYFDVVDKEGKPSAVTKGVYPDGQSLGLLVRGKGAAWSPDGAWFANVTDENSLILRNLRGEVRNIFTPEKEHLLSPSIWSPDGKRIAVISILPGNAAENVLSVVIIDVVGGKVLSKHRIPSWTTTISKFRWSPDGRKILLVGGFATSGGAVVIDTETSTVETIANKTIVAEWAPSNDSVYYFDTNSYERQSGEQALGDFYLKKLGTSQPIKLMDKKKVESLGLKAPLLMSLSPEGSKFFIYSGILPSTDDVKKEFKGIIYIYDIHGGITVTLDKPYKKFQTIAQDFIYSLEWAPDENSLAALALNFSEVATAKESPYMPTGSLKVKILDLLKGTWRTLASVNTQSVPATELLDFIGLTKTLSWSQ